MESSPGIRLAMGGGEVSRVAGGLQLSYRHDIESGPGEPMPWIRSSKWIACSLLTGMLLLSSCNADPPSPDGGAGGAAGVAGGGGSGGGSSEGGSGGVGPVTCPEPPSDVPGSEDPSVSEAKFRALSAGGFLCGIEEEGTLACWSGTGAFPTDPPTGIFEAISVGFCQACALDPGGNIRCWGCPFGDGGATPPTGSFRAIAVGRGFICGIRKDDGRVTCSGTIDGPKERGTFLALTSGLTGACGILDVEAGPNIVCWGEVAEAPPEIHAVDIGAGSHHFCALDTDGTAHCWGESKVGQTSPPPGPFVRIDGACALRPDGVPVCWGGGTLEALHDVPPGCFLDLAAFSQACALRSDGNAVCWGHPSYGDPSPP